jgi:hypothetical protein
MAENMKEHIEEELQCLIGLPLVNAGRAADMQWFHFGEQRTVSDFKGKPRLIGEYALHIQCPWRIVGREGIVVGSSDRYYPANEQNEQRGDFDWDIPGANRCDKLIQAFLQERKGFPAVVTRIESDFIGSLKIKLKGDLDLDLDVFPDDSLGKEHWRFFKPSTERPHFIITGHGIEK